MEENRRLESVKGTAESLNGKSWEIGRQLFSRKSRLQVLALHVVQPINNLGS